MSVNFHFPHALCPGIHACRRADVQAVSRRCFHISKSLFDDLECHYCIGFSLAFVVIFYLPIVGFKRRRKCRSGPWLKLSIPATGGTHRNQRGASDRSETELLAVVQCSEQESRKMRGFSPCLMMLNGDCTFIQSFHELWCAGHSISDLVRMLHK